MTKRVNDLVWDPAIERAGQITAIDERFGSALVEYADHVMLWRPLSAVRSMEVRP